MTTYDDILGTVGATPCVRLQKLAPPRVRLYVKIEAFNPMGSVKDLDSVEYQADNRGGAIRAALAARTSIVTIPQVFVNGTLIGGATDVIESWKQGALQEQLAAANVPYDASIGEDPSSFLPAWRQSRG